MIRIIKHRKRLWLYTVLIAFFLCGMNAIGRFSHLSKDTKNTFVSFSFLEKNGIAQTDADVQSMPELNAKYAVLMDASNRRILFEKNANDKAAMASTTKIMTLIIALENGKLDDTVLVSSYAASMPKVHLGMKKGEQYRLGDLLYSLMLESHNDSAVAIAEHIGGSVEGFADLMNQKATELGATHTHFVTPNGLDNKQHYSTAYDMALITSYAIENPDFLKIIQKPDYVFHEQTTGRNLHVYNKDRFLTSYNGAIGVKTGFTGNAGYCFVGAVERDGKKLVSVVLACGWPPRKNAKWEDTRHLMDYGLKNYKNKEIVNHNFEFPAIPVNDSVKNTPVQPYVKDEIHLLLRDDEKVHVDVKLPKSLEAPVKRNQRIGDLKVTIDGVLYKELAIYADCEHKRITYPYILKQIMKRFLFV
ncbi:MAG: D-alanyl-D-alanine carboxypeptidase family protein [Eubacteriales bacterium]|nr:D-alanyl-D-alanine carboxypeptidase family protein [Eubacteriales bacterium]